METLWNACEAKISDIISQTDYEEALHYCCLEHTEVIVGVVKRFVNDYANVALGVLRSDKDLASYIKAKYFSEIND